MKHSKLYCLIVALLLILPVLLLSSCAAAKGDYENFYEESIPAEKPEMGIQGGDVTVNESLTNRKIIKTYDLATETKSFDTALSELKALIESHNGYVEQNSVSNNSYYSGSARYATYTIRIPAEHAEAFVGSIGNVLNVTRNNSTVEDVSETYYSIEAVLEELQAERDSLLTIMESLSTKEDYNFWLTVQQRLSEVKQEIAVYQAQLNSYDSRVAYSTVNLSINEVVEYTPDSDLRFGDRLGDAFSNGWSAFGAFWQGIAIVFVTVFPFLLIPAAIALIVVLSVRRKKSNDKKRNDNLPQ